MRYGCYTNSFRFVSHLGDFTFVQAYVLPLQVSVRLALA